MLSTTVTRTQKPDPESHVKDMHVWHDKDPKKEKKEKKKPTMRNQLPQPQRPPLKSS